MKVTVVTFKRNVQVRPFESASYELTAELDEGDDVAEAMSSLRAWVEDALDVYARERQAREQMPF